MDVKQRRRFPGRAAAAPLALLIAGVFVGGCGSSTMGPVIGSRSVPGASQASNDTVVAAVDQRLKAELQAAQSVQSIRSGPSGTASQEMPLNSSLSLRQLERLTAIQGLGSSQIQKDLADIAKLARDLASNTRLSASEKSALAAMLSSEQSGLQAELAQLKGAPMVDMARASMQTAAAYRVQGFLDPSVHMTEAADQLLHLLDVYVAAEAELRQLINSKSAAGVAVGDAVAVLTDMDRQIAAMDSIAHSALDTLSQLRASDYPGNTPQLQAVRSSLQTAENAANTAGNDVLTIRTMAQSWP